MEKKSNPLNDFDALRSKADNIIRKTQDKTSFSSAKLALRKLRNELIIYEIELDMRCDGLNPTIEFDSIQEAEQSTEHFDLSTSGYFTLSKYGEIGSINTIAAKMLDKECSGFKNNFFNEYLTCDSKANFDSFLNDVFNCNITKTCEVSIARSFGLPRIVLLSCIGLQDKEYCLVKMIDVTTYKLKEISLQKYINQLKTITEYAPNIIMEVNKSGDILYINRTYTDHKHEEIIGRNILDFTPLDYHSITILALNRVFNERVQQTFRSRGLGGDGEMKWFQSNISPVIVSGDVKNAIIIINDITELVRTEEHRITILNTAMDGFVLLDSEGNILEVNDTYCQMIGYSKSELMSQRFLELVVNDLEVEPINHLRRVTEMGEDRFEIKLRTKDQRLLYIEVSMQYQPIDGGHFVTFLHDITEKKNIEKALIDSDQKFRDYVEHAPHGIFVANENGNYTDVNPATSQITGFTRDELLNMNLLDLLPENSIEIASEHFSTVVNNGFAAGEFAFVRKDGSKGYWSVDAVRLSQDSFLGFAIDITSHKNDEEKLKEREDLLKTVLELLPVGVWLFNEKGEIISANEEARRIWAGIRIVGIERFGEYKGWWFDSGKLIEPHEWSAARAIQKGEISIDEEIKIECFDGSSKIILNSATPLYNRNGDIRGAIVTNLDITERKIAEASIIQLNEKLESRVIERTAELVKANESLKETESKYRTVADHTYGWEFWTDQNGNFLYCSPSCERITGHKVSEFINNPQLLYDIVHPEDIKHFCCHKQREEKRLGGNMEINYRIIKPDGAIRWIGHVCQPIFDDNGIYIGNRGSNRDITERKEMEELLKTSNKKYKLVSENITDGIFICRNGFFEYVNKAMCHIFGYKADELIGKKLSQIIKPEYSGKLEALNSAENMIQNFEIEYSINDKSTIFVEFLINFIAGENVIYGVAHDITEKKLIQKNIIKAIIQTEEKERAYFSKELHDGLGPLLSTIKLYLQWSQRTNTNLSRDEIFHKAENTLEDALIAVKEISNKLSPHLLANHGLSSAIQSFVGKLEESSNIRISFFSNVERRLGDEIEAAIYRAVIECLNNTIKHARASNISINLDDNQNQLLLSYKDDGRGFNIDETLSIKKGLGLFNLQNRIQTIGGKISMYSKPGEGVNYQILVTI
jgi:PAS domain S-box-containing protein